MINRADCIICGNEVVKPLGEIFNRTVKYEGPFCDACFVFMELIEGLEARVMELEKRTKPRWNPEIQSPYSPRRSRRWD